MEKYIQVIYFKVILKQVKQQQGQEYLEEFKELDYWLKGHFLEVKREDLVGEYQGHTAVKTKEILNKVIGGILFIDEVYS